MAEALIVGAVVGAVIAQAYSDLYNVTKRAVSQMVWCKKYCKELEDELSSHLPILTEISRRSLCREWEQPLLDFKKKLEEGQSLVHSCLQLRRWSLIQKWRYSRAIRKLRQVILQHLQSLPAVNTLQLQQISAGLQDVRKQQDSDLEKMMGELKSFKNLRISWQGAISRDGGSTDDERLGKRLDELVQEDRFLVGLDNRINEVKSLLLSDEKMVLILGGMGGIGKTTLAVAICKDPQVRGLYEKRIYFFTVSQSPDMKGLLSSIWEQVVGERAPREFHNEEDAYRQVKGKLLNMPSKRRLLVLDDVWSEANLEHLLFEVKGLKTMITTRQARTLEKTRHSHTFNLELLSKENAQKLFCYWAFDRQDSIFPSWVKEPLVVKEIISECNCLPLALRVIGKCLSGVGQSPKAWRNARDKLREAKPLRDNYHEDALLRRLQTSIDALDPTLRECFLDLGAYPEDSRCSANTLLDIWVYVRGMEWVDAVLALVDLSNRCLLDLSTSYAFVEDALEISGNASDLLFSQHDVMRDLALYLGSRKDQHTSQHTRLLMPAKNIIPKDWQTEAYCSAAQVVSIISTNFPAFIWPPTLAFPAAEALILHIASHDGPYDLPHFIQSMCKLKVISIRALGGSIDIIGPSLRGLSQLQSIQMECISVGPTTLDFTTSKLEKLWLVEGDSEVVDIFLSKEMGNLTCLHAHKNCEHLPESFGNLSNLETLDLRDCDSMSHLPTTFGQLVALKKLDLEFCRKLQDLPESFGDLSNLETLDLRCCESMSHLPTTFGQLVALKKLNLYLCKKLQDLPESFGDLSNLETLDLRFCKSMSHLPTTFGQLVALKKLDLQFCRKLQDLPESFGDLSDLETLDLRFSTSLMNLPVSFGKLRRLKKLKLAYCRRLNQLPESFGQLSGLRILEMEEVGLESLPACIGAAGSLVGLESVKCSENLVPLWKAARGDIPPHPQIITNLIRDF